MYLIFKICSIVVLQPCPWDGDQNIMHAMDCNKPTCFLRKKISILYTPVTPAFYIKWFGCKTSDLISTQFQFRMFTFFELVHLARRDTFVPDCSSARKNNWWTHAWHVHKNIGVAQGFLIPTCPQQKWSTFGRIEKLKFEWKSRNSGYQWIIFVLFLILKTK